MAPVASVKDNDIEAAAAMAMSIGQRSICKTSRASRPAMWRATHPPPCGRLVSVVELDYLIVHDCELHRRNALAWFAPLFLRRGKIEVLTG
jgi:hypothetical protein